MSKKVMYVWGFIVVLICGFLIILGNVGTDITLYKIKKEIKTATEKYVDINKIELNTNESEVVYVNDLIDSKLLKKKKEIDKYCINKIKITKKLLSNRYEIINEC